MIISASYKTDIPAFYGEWFMNRLRAGWCCTTNPWGGQVSTVRLDGEAVDGFVFWTKNVGPFLGHLAEVRERGYPFVVQYTINGYPRALEYSVTDAQRATRHLHRLARDHGPRVAVWRYDPVLITSLTPADWQLGNFERLARAVQGAADEVVVSFAHFYRKTRRNLDAAARAYGFDWRDPEDEEKRELATQLAEIARAFGMRLNLCSQPEYLAAGVGEARCIDGQRLSQVAGRLISAKRKGNRPGCACEESRDIGEYDTCPHGCTYCYAVRHRGLARRRYREHDAAGAFLFPPPQGRESRGHQN